MIDVPVVVGLNLLIADLTFNEDHLFCGGCLCIHVDILVGDYCSELTYPSPWFLQGGNGGQVMLGSGAQYIPPYSRAERNGMSY